MVLDEADKMLGLGFQPQLDRLHALVMPSAPPADTPASSKPAKKTKASAKSSTAPAAGAGSGGPRPQVLLFTATMPSEVQQAAAKWLSPSAAKVTISHSAASISRTITQVSSRGVAVAAAATLKPYCLPGLNISLMLV